MRRRLVWQEYPDNPELTAEVSRSHQLPSLVARLLVNRGLSSSSEIDAYLAPELGRLHPPFSMLDLQKASHRLIQAVHNRETLAVYGDYDADGLTATALLHQFFQELGLAIVPYIPDRLTEGYGLNQTALKQLGNQTRLLVTVDCGVSDREEVAWARSHGLEVIVTDHHELPPELPPALAVINPKRPGSDYPFNMLAGVGVAFLLAAGVRAGLREAGWPSDLQEPHLGTYLDLVALGTAADVAQVVGENRILVREGLKVMANTRRPGLVALKEVAGLDGKPITYRNLVFHLAPRLNAAGRLGQARGALELLLATDLKQARVQARLLNDLNRQRQLLEEVVLTQAKEMIRRQGLEKRLVMVLAREGWHPGVLGIAAARLAEEFHRPVALVSLKDGLGAGSARSIEGFHLFQGLQKCQELLLKFGGHETAAGFRMSAHEIPALSQKLEEAFQEQVGAVIPRPILKVDARVALPDMDEEFYHHLERLRPFGPGNPEPVLVCEEVMCLKSWVVGERHLKMQLAQGDCRREAVAFDQAARHPLSGPLDVALSTRLNYFNGKFLPELRVVDWCRLTVG